MPKKKSIVQSAVETVAEIAGADSAEAAKLGETVAALAKGAEESKKPAAKKPAAKKTAAKKTAAKPAAKKTDAKKTDAKAAAKTAAKKTADKPAAKKAAESAAKKSALPIEFQCKGGNYTGEQIVEMCKAAYRNGTKKQIRTIEVYIKASKSKAYFVVNGKAEDENGNAYSIDL